MRIITNKDLYVGRFFRPNPNIRAKVTPIELSNAPTKDHENFYFHAIVPIGETEPFKIPKFTEVVRLDGTEFESFEEFVQAYENGYFDYKFNDEHKKEVFWNLIDYSNIVNASLEDYQIS